MPEPMWLLASSGTSLHRVYSATEQSPFPTSLCGRALSKGRTESRLSKGKFAPKCRRCELWRGER